METHQQWSRRGRRIDLHGGEGASLRKESTLLSGHGGKAAQSRAGEGGRRLGDSFMRRVASESCEDRIIEDEPEVKR